MANLTITVDDEVLKRARIRALEQGTSVNAILADQLRAYARSDEAQARATSSLLALADTNTNEDGVGRGRQRGKRRWTRDELHERR